MSWRVRSAVERDVVESFANKLDESGLSDDTTEVIRRSLEETTISQRSEAEQLATEIIARGTDETD